MIPLVYVLAFLLLLLFILKTLYFNPPTTNKNLPPSPPTLPVIGNLHQLGPLIHHSLHSLSQKLGGPLMLIHVGSVPTLVVSSAEAASEIMKTQDIKFANRPNVKMWKILFRELKEVTVVEERLRILSTEGGDGIREDFVGMLLKVQKDDKIGVTLDRQVIKALLMDAYVAGTDTSSTLLEWAFAELLKHPSILKKVQDEVRTVLKGKQVINQDDITNMKYLKAVMKEALRLHPPLPTLVPRVARQDAKVMGYDVAKGTRVIINAWTIARDPKVWDDPNEFRPERFLDSSIDFKGRDFSLIPFGSGRRGCPGVAFAMTTNESMLANLLYNFDWALPNGGKEDDLDMTEQIGFTVRKNTPLLVTAKPFSI
ncbi:putative psoralen synthase [Helianthus annuus]|nr:putative psoralen synthase [Helianthus annuus]